MSIPSKVLAEGLFRRGETGAPDAATASELLFSGAVRAEYQRKERASRCRWGWPSCISSRQSTTLGPERALDGLVRSDRVKASMIPKLVAGASGRLSCGFSNSQPATTTRAPWVVSWVDYLSLLQRLLYSSYRIPLKYLSYGLGTAVNSRLSSSPCSYPSSTTPAIPFAPCCEHS